MSENYSVIGGIALIVVLISGYKYGRDTSSGLWKKIFMFSGGLFVVMLVADIAFDITPQSKQTAPPVVQESKEPIKPPEVQRPEKSFYKESYEAIAAATGLRVTEHWLLEYGERVATKDGNVDTHGYVEFNNDGVKRQFWLMFDGQTRRILRVKIDSELIYSEIGW